MHFQMHATPRRPSFLAAVLLALLTLPATSLCHAADSAKPAAPSPDTIVLINGDQISGTFVNEVDGTVTFHSDILGDLSIPWDKIKELHTRTKVAVLQPNSLPRRNKLPTNLPVGTLSVHDNLITVQAENNAIIPQIPVANAKYIIDDATLHKQVFGRPGFFQGWNGTATAGLTLVQATQNQYSFAGAVALARAVPTVSWLDPRNRTTLDYAQSYGKITQPAYVDASGNLVPASSSKTSIFHLGVERDEYFSPRFYFLGVVSFDHNFSQSLDLQQIYGGGIGYTVLKTPVQELDVTAIMQYERQSFMNVIPPAAADQNLIASTFAGSYMRHLSKSMLFTQQLQYIPAWNNLHAYSFNETDLLAFPAYKNFSLSLGTLDTYLNDVPFTFPATKRNSFQFTAGVTYNFKSTY
ncbi:MAG: DUF481 domain-containing protein [Silvibacterium sp.]